MNIDMGALHAIEVDRGIPVDELLDTISSALLTAYRHTDGHQPDARIEIDRKMLSDLAVREPEAFKALVDTARDAVATA